MAEQKTPETIVEALDLTISLNEYGYTETAKRVAAAIRADRADTLARAAALVARFEEAHDALRAEAQRVREGGE